MLKLFRQSILALIVAGAVLVSLPSTSQAARTDTTWNERSTWLETAWPEGRNILINGTNKYLNFGSISGTSGYGLRDNAGTIEFKNSGGSWIGIGTGSGGGSAAGTMSTTTSTVNGQLINHPNNDTDILTVGSNSTTTAEFYFDPNTLTAKLPYASTTMISATTASSSALIASNSATFSFLGTGLLKVTSGALGLAVAGTDYLTSTYKDWQISGGYLTPTTTQVVKVDGFISTASSTFNGNLNIAGNATTTNLSVSTEASTSRMVISKVLALPFLANGLTKVTSGIVSIATPGVDYLTSAYSNWQLSGGYLTPTTTQTVLLNNGFVSAASSTVSGQLTVTGNLGLSSSTPTYALSLGTGSTAFSVSSTGVATTSSINTTSTATSTIAGGINLKSGCYAINGNCVGGTGGGSGTVTSVGASGPTGLTWSSAVTTSGTLTATLNSGFSLRKLPSYVVGASGGDFTTIQAALDAAGTAGGGSIYLTDSTYTQGGTGLTFKSSNTNIYCRNATTTITITGATTAFKTNSAASAYAYNGIHGCVVTGDGNTSSIAFDLSDMNHFNLEQTITDNVGTWVRGNDTQNTSFYNIIKENTATTITAFGLNASSTNPWNKNTIIDNFIGCAANCVAIQLTNANGNTIMRNSIEPASITGTVGIKIFNNTLATNDGVFNNNITDNYIEGNATGISVANAVGSGGGIKRNIFTNNTVESNTADYSLGSQVVSLNTFINNYDSNFGNPLTSLQGPVGISTSTELVDINGTPWAFFGINPTAGVALNQFAIGSSTATSLIVNNSGNLGLSSTTPTYRLSSGSGATAFSVSSTGVATATAITITGIPNCDSVDTDSSGKLICGTDATGGAGFSGPANSIIVSNAAGNALVATSSDPLYVSKLVATSTNPSIFAGGILVTASSTFNGNATTTGMHGFGSIFLNNDLITDLTGAGLIKSTGALTVDDVTPAMLQAADFGDFTCNGTNCALDASYALQATTITAGEGLIGGGDLSTNRTINIDANSTITVNADSIAINLANANTWTAKQNFFGAASSTLFSANYAQFGATATTTLTSDGKFGIASSTPTYALSVNSGTSAFSVDTSGVATSTVFNTTSTTVTSIMQLLKTVLSLVIPTGTGPTVDEAGEIAFDTTDLQILIATSTNASYPGVIPVVQKLWGATIASSSVDFISGGVIPMPPQRDGFTVKEIHCYVDGGTSVVINISNSAGSTDSETLTCDADGATDTDITTNNTYVAGSLNRLEIGTVSGTVDYLTFSVYGTYTRE